MKITNFIHDNSAAMTSGVGAGAPVGGDLGGSTPTPVVVGIGGVPINPTPPAAGQVPVYDSGSGTIIWETPLAVGGLPWFNVKAAAYGAVGDGTTDDTAAINLAIAALNTATRGVLYFPAGSYKTVSALTAITATVIVRGDGSASFDYAVWGSSVFSTSGSAVLFTINSKAARFENIGLLSNSGGTPTAGSAVLVDGSYQEQRCDFSDVHVRGFYDCLDVKVGAQWVMHGVLITAPVRYGIRIRNTVNGDAGDWSISDCNFYADVYNATAAIRLESSGGGKIVNCKFNMALSGSRFGRCIDASLAAATSILLIANCSFENYTGDAIHLDGGGSTFYFIKIAGCQWGQYGYGTGNAIYTTACDDIVIDDYVLRADTGTPTAFNLNAGARGYVGHGTNFGFATLLVSSTFTSLVDGTVAAMVNPMTTKGDLVVGDTSGVPTRAAAGSVGTVWTANGAGAFPTWQTVTASSGELLMEDGVTAPPVPIETEARDDWLYSG